MRQNQRLLYWLVAGLMLLALGLAGCAAKSDAPAKKAKPAKAMMTPAAKAKMMMSFPCAGKGKLIRATSPEAKLAGFDCKFKKWKGQKVLHFNVKIKNVSDVPQRYKVNIFMDNDKAVGGLIPRKTKKGLVKPGATAGFSYPVKGMTTKPGAVTLLVKTMSK